MKTKQYDLWIQDHRIQLDPIDITEATLASLAQPKQGPLARACACCKPGLFDPNVLVRGAMLGIGAVTGLLRTALFVYYALFV